MGRRKTEKSPYKSKFMAEKWVTPAHYLAELVCEKRAGLKGKKLPMHFWKLPEWEKAFLDQIYSAHKLLKIYSASALIAALEDERLAKVYSLNSPLVDEVAEQFDQQRTATDGKLVASPDIVLESKSIFSQPRKTTPLSAKSLMRQIKEREAEIDPFA